MADVSMRILLSAVGGSAVTGIMADVAKSLGSGSGGVAGNLTMVGVAAAGAAIAIGVTAAKMAGDFQSSMTRLVTSAGELPQNLQMVSDGILKMSVDTATSTDQLAQGMYFLESSGIRAGAGLAALGTAARGAKSENADLTVVSKALAGVLVNYHMNTSTAAAATISSTSAMNGLISTVQNGTTTLQELSSSMGAVLPIASSLGISFPQVAGSLDTMTNHLMPAQQAAQNLAHVLVALNAPSKVATKSMIDVGLSAQQVKDTLANQGLPQALQLIEDHVGKKFPAGSVAGETALKNILGGLVGLKLAAMLTGGSLAETKANIAKVSDAMKNGHGAVMGWTDVQGTFNFKMGQAHEALNALMITIGTGLLPVIGNIVGAIAPAIGAFSNWIMNVDHARPILIGLGVAIAVSLLPVIWSLAAGVISATWPFLLIAAAVAGAVAIFQHFYTTNAPFRAFIDGLVKSLQQLWQTIQANIMPAIQQLGAFFQAYIMPILQQIGSFIVSQFVPVWQQLVQLWNGQLMPLFKQLWNALQPLMPLFQFIGQVVGGIVVVAFVMLVGIIQGVISAVATVFSDIASAVGGVVQIITGIVQIISGILSFIKDLFTGNWKALGGDLKGIWQGIVNVFGGIFQTMGSILHAIFGGIGSFISGFAQGVLNTIGNILGGADKARIQAEMQQNQMKINSVNTAIQTASQVLKVEDKKRQDILKELENTKDPKKRAELEMKLSAITTKEQEAKGVLDAEEKKKQLLLKKQAELKKQMDEANKSLVQKTIEWFGNLKDGIGGKLTDLKNMVGGWFSSFGGFWHDSWNGLANIVTGVWNNIVGGVKGLINNFIGLINGIINGINGISGKIGIPAIPDIPLLARGGIVPPGGVAIVGESGPEIVAGGTGGLSVLGARQSAGILSPRQGAYGGAGGGNVTNHYWNINLSTMARSQSEVSTLVDMFEAELASRFRTQTPSYASGNIF